MKQELPWNKKNDVKNKIKLVRKRKSLSGINIRNIFFFLMQLVKKEKKFKAKQKKKKRETREINTQKSFIFLLNYYYSKSCKIFVLGEFFFKKGNFDMRNDYFF